MPAAFTLRLLLLLGAVVSVQARDVTFLSTSDQHYRQEDHAQGNHNALNAATIAEMNGISKLTWPEKLGGGLIAKPRAVLSLGDLIDNGDSKVAGRVIGREQFALYAADFGVLGGDAKLAFPTQECWGNHDGPPVGKEKSGFSLQAELIKRNQLRKEKGLISNLSANGLHTSWDWDDVHFVQLGLYPADVQHPGVKYNRVWHDPQAALTFLKQDLAEKVGTSGRPVVLMSHCGFDTDWWHKEDWKAAYDAAKAYNVVLYIYGHTGTGVRAWAPEGETKKWDCINDGHTDLGFFAVQLTDDRIRAGNRTKSGVKSIKDPQTKATRFTWDGQWEWKFLFERKLAPVTK
jgi:cytolysin (calcineurin-like family phosphatase)